MKAAFYGGRPWREKLEAVVMLPLIADCSAVVVEDAVGLWSRWPESST
jgi:hypothetical protein